MLSKTAEYALRAVVYLAARTGDPASAELLSEKTQVPRRYVHRVLQDLARSGLVSSRSGPGGGYFLSPEAARRCTILDVVNAVSPLARIRQCPLGLRTHRSLCPLHARLDEAYAATEAAFASVTIDELVNSTSPIVPLCEK
jgi:Rrf2 family protein